MAPNDTPRRRNFFPSPRAEAAARLGGPPGELTPADAEARRQAAAKLLAALPQDLQREQPSILMSRFDEITAAIEQFNLEARRLGTKYGIHGAEFALMDPQFEAQEEAANRNKLLDWTWRLMIPRECFQLTRVGEQGWGIYYRWRPPIAGAQAGTPEVCQPITAVRIDLKRTFLRKSGDFFKDYLLHVRQTVDQVDGDLASAAAVLYALKSIG